MFPYTIVAPACPLSFATVIKAGLFSTPSGCAAPLPLKHAVSKKKPNARVIAVPSCAS
jgi:hypothetical protein